MPPQQQQRQHSLTSKNITQQHGQKSEIKSKVNNNRQCSKQNCEARGVNIYIYISRPKQSQITSIRNGDGTKIAGSRRQRSDRARREVKTGRQFVGVASSGATARSLC